MTAQIKEQAKSFRLEKYFGPYMAKIIIPEKILDSLQKMTNQIIQDPGSNSHGSKLVGRIEKELTLRNTNFEEAGVSYFLQNCVSTYVLNCAKAVNRDKENIQIKTGITSAWVNSQYEHEYNPVHNHVDSGDEISGVFYLKCPDFTERRVLKNKVKKNDLDGQITFVYDGHADRFRSIFERGFLHYSPVAGDMFIFPSYLLHSVSPFIGKEERRSVAFNATYQITEKRDKDNYLIAGNKDFSERMESIYFYK